MYRERLQRLKNSVAFKQPYNRIFQERMKLDGTDKYLLRAFKANTENKRNSISVLIAKLDALSPLNILSRGYSVARHIESGIIIKSITDVNAGEKIDINVFDGEIRCSVNEAVRSDVRKCMDKGIE
jgi:exodeoxyribonuclease VII large subunit